MPDLLIIQIYNSVATDDLHNRSFDGLDLNIIEQFTNKYNLIDS